MTDTACHATLVVLRHGESHGNAERAFAGWRDVALTANGEAQATAAAGVIAAAVGVPHAVWTSRLTRATATADRVLAALAAMHVERHADWRLNERHCGRLQGKPKDECKREFGRDLLRSLREQWHTRPPLVDAGSSDDPRVDPRYADVAGELPRGESLAELAARVAPVWHEVLAPRLAAGRTLLVVGHAMALRALLRPLEGITDARLPAWSLGNAAPRIYRLDAALRPVAVLVAGGPGDDADE